MYLLNIVAKHFRTTRNSNDFMNESTYKMLLIHHCHCPKNIKTIFKQLYLQNFY